MDVIESGRYFRILLLIVGILIHQEGKEGHPHPFPYPPYSKVLLLGAMDEERAHPPRLPVPRYRCFLDLIHTQHLGLNHPSHAPPNPPKFSCFLFSMPNVSDLSFPLLSYAHISFLLFKANDDCAN